MTECGCSLWERCSCPCHREGRKHCFVMRAEVAMATEDFLAEAEEIVRLRRFVEVETSGDR